MRAPTPAKWQLLVLLCFCFFYSTSQSLISEPVFHQIARLTSPLPKNVSEAYRTFEQNKVVYDSLEEMIQKAYPLLADRMARRSMRLNMMAGYTEQDAVLSLMPPNQKMRDFFLREWEKMDALEKRFNQKIITDFSVKLSKEYLKIWDSVYRNRLPTLTQYRDGIFTLVKAEIGYLKANAKMLHSQDENERMQYHEAELSILQKLVLLGAKYHKIVFTDAVEKMELCKQYPETCQ